MLDWRNYAAYGIPVFFGFLLRWVNERRKNNKVDVRFQLICSLGVSYFAYLWYRDKKVEVCSIEIWLGCWSYFGNLVVTVADKFFVHGWKAYLNILLEKFTTSLKEPPHDTE
jgi:drug/metabolite transporter superfamily protein YnfA